MTNTENHENNMENHEKPWKIMKKTIGGVYMIL